MNKESYIYFYNTSPIWHKEEFSIKQFQFPKIDIDTFLPQEIPTNLRLGHKIEYIFHQLVSVSDTHEIKVYNLPIRKEKRTLGEIDFIIKDRTTDQYIHVELTYKFYLIDPKIEEPIKRLIGPNRKDSFYEKIQKIKLKQFPLLHSECGSAALIEKRIDPTRIAQQCCFKAQIFHPYKNDNIEMGAINKNCIAGYWLHFEEFTTIEFQTA